MVVELDFQALYMLHVHLSKCYKIWLWHEESLALHCEAFSYLFINSIWWSRNSCIFSTKDIHVDVTMTLISIMYREYKIPPKIKKIIVHIQPSLRLFHHMGFF